MKRLLSLALLLLAVSSVNNCGGGGGGGSSGTADLSGVCTLSGAAASCNQTTSSDCPTYDRSLYGNWIDADSDCQNTRAEVLIQENLGSLTFSSSSGCTVDTGEWYDPYTDQSFYYASSLDVDHFVPLKEAHESGGWAWDSTQRKQFANFLGDSNHLIAVSASANRSKGARDPSEWLPTNQAYHVQYAKAWVGIKVLWGLTSDSKELDTLRSILANEPNIVYPTEAEETTCTGSDARSSSTSSSQNTSTSCCKVCTPGKSKACGNACISIKYQCSKPVGCACNGS